MVRDVRVTDEHVAKIRQTIGWAQKMTEETGAVIAGVFAGHIFSPRISVENAIAQPVRATEVIAASRCVSASLVASTYQLMEQVTV